MDRTRKANREGNEVTLQHQSRNESSLIEALVEEKLAELQASIEQLQQTPEGLAELQRRVKAFGECQRIAGESPGQFYDKLRRWMDREALPTKSPLHPPRQDGGYRVLAGPGETAGRTIHAGVEVTVRDNTIEAEIAIEDRRPRDSGK